MSAKKINLIKIEEILASLGHFPSKISGDDVWFFNPFSEEKNSSFKISRSKNVWYLFSEGTGGGNIDFIMKYFNCTISEAIKWAFEQSFFSFHQREDNVANLESKKYKIISVLDKISNKNLIEYLQKRKVFRQSEKLEEVHYEVENNKNEIKKFYGIAFKNNSENSFEISSPYWKGCLGRKDISLIKNNSKNVVVFEAFFDYLSFLELNLFEEKKSDYLILNSVSLLKKSFDFLAAYSNIYLLLDNDLAGDKCTRNIIEFFPEAKDIRVKVLGNFKDVNDLLINSI